MYEKYNQTTRNVKKNLEGSAVLIKKPPGFSWFLPFISVENWNDHDWGINWNNFASQYICCLVLHTVGKSYSHAASNEKLIWNWRLLLSPVALP